MCTSRLFGLMAFWRLESSHYCSRFALIAGETPAVPGKSLTRVGSAAADGSPFARYWRRTDQVVELGWQRLDRLESLSYFIPSPSLVR